MTKRLAGEKTLRIGGSSLGRKVLEGILATEMPGDDIQVNGPRVPAGTRDRQTPKQPREKLGSHSKTLGRHGPPWEPPPEVLAHGGHVLLCILGRCYDEKESSGASKELLHRRERVGLKHFMQPLRGCAIP